MLDPNNYESTEALNPDELLEYGSASQVEIDGLESDVDDLKAKLKTKKEEMAKHSKRISMIFHAQESGASLYKLKDGGITEEGPDLEGSLPLGPAPQQEVELPLDDDTPLEEAADYEEEELPDEGPGFKGYPDEQDGQVYKAKGTLGNTLTVKQSATGWTGRISGKPVAINLGSARDAMAGVEDYLNEDFVLDWQPTIEIAEVSEEDADAEFGVEL